MTSNTYSYTKIVGKLVMSRANHLYETIYLEMSHVTFLFKNRDINKHLSRHMTNSFQNLFFQLFTT